MECMGKKTQPLPAPDTGVVLSVKIHSDSYTEFAHYASRLGISGEDILWNLVRAFIVKSRGSQICCFPLSLK
jgi:hypothetical protein